MGSIPILLSFQLSVNSASPIQLLSTMFNTILSRPDRPLLRRLDAFLLKNLQLQKPSLTRCCLLTQCVNHQVTGHPHVIWSQSRTVTGAPVVTIELSMQPLNQTVTLCLTFRIFLLVLLVVKSSPRLTWFVHTIKFLLLLRMSLKQQSLHHSAFLSSNVCHMDCAMRPRHFNDSWMKSAVTWTLCLYSLTTS